MSDLTPVWLPERPHKPAGRITPGLRVRVVADLVDDDGRRTGRHYAYERTPSRAERALATHRRRKAWANRPTPATVHSPAYAAALARAAIGRAERKRIIDEFAPRLTAARADVRYAATNTWFTALPNRPTDVEAGAALTALIEDRKAALDPVRAGIRAAVREARALRVKDRRHPGWWTDTDPTDVNVKAPVRAPSRPVEEAVTPARMVPGSGHRDAVTDPVGGLNPWGDDEPSAFGLGAGGDGW